MTYDEWKKRVGYDGTSNGWAESAWTAAVTTCKEAIESCRNLTPAVDGGVSEEELRKYRQTVEDVVNVAQALIDRPDQPHETAG